MISVMMNSSETEPYQRNDAVRDSATKGSILVPVVGDGGKPSSKISDSFVDSVERVEVRLGSKDRESGEARVSMESGNASNYDNDNSDISIVVDFDGSAESRVLKGVDEGNDFRVCEINKDRKQSNVNENKAIDMDIENHGTEDKGDIKSKALELVPKKVELRNANVHKKQSVPDYNLMLSMFDEFAKNGNPWAVGYGYEIGDMVWGKVKSHPWWPGHIYNDAFATPTLRRSKREGHVLVAFFGDSSYGWFDPAELIPFEPNFAEKSRQTNTRHFVQAVDEAIDEVSRRSWLGLACRCRNPYNFRPTSVDGFFAVDVGEYEPGGVFSVSQIQRARDSFQPREMLAFVKRLAVTPMTNGHGNINFIKHKATALAFRKAVFEEFDETYAQAFGAQPLRPESKTAADLQREPSRAPLSGPLVIAEALGKGKASGRPTKSKDRVEKDRYLFKRRDEASELKTRKADEVQSGSSRESIQIDGSDISGKRTPPSVGDQVYHTTASTEAEASLKHASAQRVNDQVVSDKEFHAEAPGTLTEVRPKKVKVHKRPAGEMSSQDAVPLEKKKKRKKEIGVGSSSGLNQKQIPAVAGKVGASLAKVAEKLVQVPSPSEGDSKTDNQRKAEVESVLQVPSAAEGASMMESQLKSEAASASMLKDLAEPQHKSIRNTEAEFPPLLSDLKALALNPFHGEERSSPLTMQNVFLKFRSLVYQKSSVSFLPTETESDEVRSGKSPASPALPGNPPMERVREVSAVKLQKPSSRPEDPTIGGRKRGPSDRQEQLTAKKKKKINDLKSLTAEKKVVQKAPEARRGEAKEVPVKAAAPTLTKTVRPEAGKRVEMSSKVPNPTMLIMKFPPDGSLPSLNELKAKFARFGPLDSSRIRIYWQSSQVRLVYLHKSHAQEALKFATSSNVLFGNTNVRSYLRDLAIENPESGSAKVQKEDASFGSSQSREPVDEPRQPAKLVPRPQEQPLQLKSCLRKSSGDDCGGAYNGGNGGGRATRVKFMLGVEESSKTEPLMVGNRNYNNIASFADGGASSHAMDFNSKNIQNVISPPQISSSPPLLPTQLPKASNNMQFNEGVSRNVPNFNTLQAPPPMISTTNNVDITQQMLSLLTKCHDLVSNMTGVLGYVPYRPL